MRDAKDLARAVEALALQCRALRTVAARTGIPDLREASPGFAGLARAIVGQQLSAQSAAAIWGRLLTTVSPFEARALLALSDDALRAPGLSAGKMRTLRALADAVASGRLDFAHLDTQPEAMVLEELTRLPGIGPWTAQIYLLFALRRADAFPAGDLALQLAAQRVLRLPARPGTAELSAIAARRWRPFRAAAARLLWADYALHQSRTPRKGPKTAP